jgi:hypothetical protein
MSKFVRSILPFIAGMMMANEGEIPKEEGGNMGENSLCLKCESYNIADRVKSCYIANSFEVFCKRNKVEAIIINCKGFIEQKAIIIKEEK